MLQLTGKSPRLNRHGILLPHLVLREMDCYLQGTKLGCRASELQVLHVSMLDMRGERAFYGPSNTSAFRQAINFEGYVYIGSCIWILTTFLGSPSTLLFDIRRIKARLSCHPKRVNLRLYDSRTDDILLSTCFIVSRTTLLSACFASKQLKLVYGCQDM